MNASTLTWRKKRPSWSDTAMRRTDGSATGLILARMAT
jgi:hypothetical protein